MMLVSRSHFSSPTLSRTLKRHRERVALPVVNAVHVAPSQECQWTGRDEVEELAEHHPKRRRAEETLPQHGSPYSCYVRPSYRPYWFDDGDLILVVVDHIFKLKGAMLSCSDIFGDMFTLAQPAGEECFEGCPVLHLADKPQDWMLLLQWIDDSDQFWREDKITYESIAGSLRISTKYEIPELRKVAVHHIHRIWPRSLLEIGELAFSPHRSDAISLARQSDLPEILPAIFYSLAVEHQQEDPIPVLLENLSDQRRLVAGIVHLREFYQRTMDSISHLRMCTSCSRCVASLWSKALERAGNWLLFALWELCYSDDLNAERMRSVCIECCDLHFDFVFSRMHRLIDLIPMYFELVTIS
ncbi:hypothetical protein BV25DRAFT_1828169 [Artomyces pyxidatus]|uniref:Uncharacterized protein n=1 Tax=Artomyces pyxidatus TaxID=48021 RepID=A0ACB8SUA3_9AGAM|nr:hypothetical protein BV25DRAFT_1828169 [Artomyces pyxidatus]